MKKNEKPINENYFEKIDTPNKAYFLGFMYADGNVNSKTNAINISLQERDGYILEKFKMDLESEHKIYLKEIKGGFKCGRQHGFTFAREKMKKDLIKLGCHPRKTWDLKFPSFLQVPENLIFHFIRGFFDGDGTIGQSSTGRHKNPQFNFIVCGTYEMCNGVNDIFVNFLGLPRQKIVKKENIWIYNIGGNNSVRKIFEAIYKDAESFLTRKKEKLEKVFDCPLRGQTSKFKGVSWNKNIKKWYSCTYKKGKQIGLGYYETEEEAADAYNNFKKFNQI